MHKKPENILKNSRVFNQLILIQNYYFIPLKEEILKIIQKLMMKIMKVTCWDCEFLEKCQEPTICIHTNYAWFLPADKTLCEECKHYNKKNSKCEKDNNPCALLEFDESKIDSNWKEYENYYDIMYRSNLKYKNKTSKN